MRFSVLIVLLFAALVTACGNHSQPASTATVRKSVDSPKTNLDKEHSVELMNVLACYYGLKDALVASDSNKANAAASKLMSAMESFQLDLGDKPEYTEMQPQLKKINDAGDSILSLKGSAIEQQRASFYTISDAMFKVLKMAKLEHGGVYQQHCPMAFDNKGADWLSNEEEIKNPYFGKKMLECGEVKDSL